jgi:hypothetical protein
MGFAASRWRLRRRLQPLDFQLYLQTAPTGAVNERNSISRNPLNTCSSIRGKIIAGRKQNLILPIRRRLSW